MDVRTHISLGILFSLIGVVFLWEENGLKMFDMVLWVSIFSMVPNVDRTLLRKGNRSFTHSLLFVAAVFLVLIILPRTFDIGGLYISHLIGTEGAIYASLAMASHIIADSLTNSGVPILYPLLPRRHFLLPYFGPRLRLPDDYKNNHIQVLALLAFIALLIVDLLVHI